MPDSYSVNSNSNIPDTSQAHQAITLLETLILDIKSGRYNAMSVVDNILIGSYNRHSITIDQQIGRQILIQLQTELRHNGN